MIQTTIKVPSSVRDRLKARAAAHGLTLGQEIERLLDEQAERPKPSIGGFRSTAPLSAEEIDSALASGFGQ